MKGTLESLTTRKATTFPRCALSRWMHGTCTADWWGARLTWQLTSLSLWGSLRYTCLRHRRKRVFYCKWFSTDLFSPIKGRSDNSHAAPLKMYLVVSRAFNSPSNWNASSWFPCDQVSLVFNIRVRIELTKNDSRCENGGLLDNVRLGYVTLVYVRLGSRWTDD